jgi:hypothetical protein
MNAVSPKSANTVTKKNYRPLQVVARKRIAYQELTEQEMGNSQRTASKLLKIPRTTFQTWEKREALFNRSDEELIAFYRTPEGMACLHRIITAAGMVINFGGSGVRGIQEFLELSGLDKLVASSTGAIHKWISTLETKTVEIGEELKQTLAKGMPKKKISLVEDESFHNGKPCLVAIDALSNYIFVEKYAEQRTAEEWNKATREGFSGLDVEVLQSTSDEGTAILAHVKSELKAEHSPDTFHVQQELSRATAGPLSAQEREFEKGVEKAESKLKKSIVKHGEFAEKTEEAKRELKLKKYGLEIRRTRRATVRAANKGIGQDYHPVDIATGQLQTSQAIEAKLKARVAVIEEACQEACLSENGLKRIEKAKDVLTTMIKYLSFFFLLLKSHLESLKLSAEYERYMKEILIPLAYLERVWRKATAKEREKMKLILEGLRIKAREGPGTDEIKIGLKKAAEEIAGFFQRSSSCVEGRNGWLRMKYHSFHGLCDRKLKALTVIHNYHIQRADGTTAAERFFGKKHKNLFESILERAPSLGWPRRSKTKIAA